MLKELTSRYEHCALECDGLTRVLHTVLSQEGIEHTCMVGSVVLTESNTGSVLHFWIVLPNGDYIDYRARMWLGDRADVPHGIFNPVDYPKVTYSGSPVQLEILSPSVFTILTV